MKQMISLLDAWSASCLLVRRVIQSSAAGVEHKTLCGATPAGVLQKQEVFLTVVFFFHRFHFTLNYNAIS